VIHALGLRAKRFLVTHRRNAFVRKLDRQLVRLHEAIENRNYDGRANGEQRVLDVLGRHHPMHTILDVGANTGEWTVYASARFPGARVFSLEVVESTYRTLVANCAGRPNVSLHHLGLSDESGEIEIFLHEGASQLATSVRGSIESFHGLSTRSEKGSVTTGDGFCETQGIDDVDFLKIDVEGMEDRVLTGFARMLRQERIGLIQFEYGYVNVMTKFLLKDFYDILTRHGMVIGKIYPTYVDFRDYELTHEDFLGPNYLAVHSSLPGVVQALGE
jgi:FkbM family methyltransferase